MELKSTMYGQSRMLKRGAIYYFRACVPADLQSHYGRKEIIYSLKTKDYAEAKRLVRRASAALDEEFDSIRIGQQAIEPKTLTVLDDETIQQICDQWRYQCLTTDAWSRSNSLSDTEYAQYKTEREETLESMRQILAQGKLDQVAPALHQFLWLIGVKFSGREEDYRKLAYAFVETAIDTHKAQMNRDEGEVVRTPPQPRPAGLVKSIASETDSKDVRFKNCFEIWEHAVLNRPTKTVSDFKSVTDDFVAWAGDRPVGQYTSDEVYKFAAFVQKRDGLEPETVEKKITFLRAIYNAANKRLRCLPQNPFSGIVIPKERNKKDARLPYDTEDFKKIYSSPIYTQGKRPRGGAGEASVWLPVIAQYTGAREEEIGQLLVTDVKCESGIHYLSITDLDEQTQKKLKTASSRRKVPLHPELIRIGFLHYVEKMRKKGAVYLFPELREDCHSKRTGNWSKWWGRDVTP